MTADFIVYEGFSRRSLIFCQQLSAHGWTWASSMTIGCVVSFSATLAQDVLAECDQPGKSCLKFSARPGNWAWATERTDREIHSPCHCMTYIMTLFERKRKVFHQSGMVIFSDLQFWFACTEKNLPAQQPLHLITNLNKCRTATSHRRV